MTIEPNQAAAELAANAPVRPDSPTFTELGARPETVAALTDAGIVRSFAIQEYAIPIALRGTDLIGQARVVATMLRGLADKKLLEL